MQSSFFSPQPNLAYIFAHFVFFSLMDKLSNQAMERCEYCKSSEKVLEVCPHCEKVWYCSTSHLTRHAQFHEPNCFPAIIQEDENCGRYWSSTRDIVKGELIFSEKALVIGPNSEYVSPSPLYPTCLGCCRRTNNSYFCSKCRWPMCSKQCEKCYQHADFECKVFRKNKVNSSSRPEYYLYVQLLRAILLKLVNPIEFQKMMELEAHVDSRRKHDGESRITKAFYKFLSEDCNMEYDFDFVDQVVGVNRINSYSADVLCSQSKIRACTALFWKMSLINHDCLPNTRTVTYENPDLSLTLGLFASVDIKKGQCITQQYFPVVKGTMQRRKALKEWFFDCTCKRCSDPTELGTFFSCLSCNKCDKGFICPLDSLNEFSNWHCNSCNNSRTSCDQVQNLIKGIEDEIQESEHSVETLESVLNIMSKRQIHSHHYLAINVQYEILRKVVRALNNEREVQLLQRCVRYCKTILNIVDVICPGFSYYRGVILYFLGNCWFSLYELGQLLNKESDCGGGFKELKKTIQNGIEIMEVEPKGSIYREMAEELETFQRALLQVK